MERTSLNTPELEENRITIFPWVLVRVAGLSFDELSKLRDDKLTLLTASICDVQSELKVLREQLTGHLFAAIQGTPRKQDRHRLLTLKRDLHKHGSVDRAAYDLLNDDIGPLLSKLAHLVDEEKSLVEHGKLIYARGLQRAIESLAQIASGAVVKNGIVLSSCEFYDKAYGPEMQNSEHEAKSGIANGLIKYISRICGKTSPFSTFTSVLLASTKERDNGQEPDHGRTQVPLSISSGGKVLQESGVLLNSEILLSISTLLFLNDQIARHLDVRLNGTIERQDNEWRFLINSHNVESFQRVQAIDGIDLVIETLEQFRQSSCSYGCLVDQLMQSDMLSSSREECEAFIDGLLAYGLLEFDLQVSSMDSAWDVQLRDKLAPLRSKIPVIADLCDALESLRDMSNAIGVASAAERRRLLDEGYRVLEGICTALHQAAGLPAEERNFKSDDVNEAYRAAAVREFQTRLTTDAFEHYWQTRFYLAFNKEQIFYEDSRLVATASIDEQSLRTLALAVERLYGFLDMLDIANIHREQMHRFFLKQYGSSQRVSVLSFYEEYYRHLKSKQTDGGRGAGGAAGFEGGLHLFTDGWGRRKQQIVAWGREYCKEPPNLMPDGSVDLRSSRLERVNQAIGYRPAKRFRHGGSATVQFCCCGEERPVRWVLNAAPPGYGKMMSRFLHLFPPNVTDELRCWNERMAGESIFAEASDATFFNANMHPPLMPYEIAIPGSQMHGKTHGKQTHSISIKDLEITVGAGNELELRHIQTQQRVFVYDLGFQGHQGRAPLYWLLCEFSRNQYLLVWEALEWINLGWRNSQGDVDTSSAEVPVRFPRVTFDDILVLQREHWVVRRSCVPFKRVGQTNWHHQMELNAWRRQWGIPKDVYVCATEKGLPSRPDGETTGGSGQRRSKPQLIDFDSPMFTTVWNGLRTHPAEYLRIEEMLPRQKDLLSIAGNRYAVELNVQWEFS